MAGAFGSATGDIDPTTQSNIASNYRFNIAYGARLLAAKWAATPRIGDGDPATIENWYYALWAYNGWGWVNNPNNPHFSRSGTPATNPAAFPYQERVLYFVSHPPHDADGNPLWAAVPVTLPAAKQIGSNPKHFVPQHVHRQPPPPVDATYKAPSLGSLNAGAAALISVRLVNTGTQAWSASGSSAISLAYHVLSAGGNPWGPLSPFAPGMVAFGQGVTPLPHDVLPGSAVTVPIQVVAPTTGGRYWIVWDLQLGVSTWLSGIGIPPYAETLTVVGAGQEVSTPTPTPRTVVPQVGLKYVADTSIPDGSQIVAGANFFKGWLIYNNGKHPWQPGWALHLVSGRPFNARTIPVPALHACRTLDLVTSMRAPHANGRYVSVWQLRDGSGHAIGDRLTVVIEVVKGSRHTPTPTPAPTPAPSLTVTPAGPTPTPTPVG
jgi:hypothetical protein